MVCSDFCQNFYLFYSFNYVPFLISSEGDLLPNFLKGLLQYPCGGISQTFWSFPLSACASSLLRASGLDFSSRRIRNNWISFPDTQHFHATFTFCRKAGKDNVTTIFISFWPVYGSNINALIKSAFYLQKSVETQDSLTL